MGFRRCNFTKEIGIHLDQLRRPESNPVKKTLDGSWVETLSRPLGEKTEKNPCHFSRPA
jgi:hypothetical protein